MSGEVHAVLGAAGTVGGELVLALNAIGVPVRAVQRRAGPAPAPGVEHVVADVGTPNGAAAAVAGAAAVYVCVQPPYHRWPQQFPALVAAIADAAGRVGARLVLLDNLYGYGPVTGAMTEVTPLEATSRKGRTRAAIAQDLLARHARGEVSVVLGRASDFVGARGVSAPNKLVLEPVAAGRKARWLGRLDQPHAVSYVPDVARALAALGTAVAAPGTAQDVTGRAWHLPISGTPTGGEFATLAHRLGGVHDEPGLVTPLMNRMAGVFSPTIREGNEMMYEFTAPFLVDDTAFRRAFPAVSSTPLEAAVAAALAARHRAAAAAAA